MHLTQRANTLGAEINLAARATVLRRDHAGNRITDARRLISSSAFGSPDRSSDPNISQGVNLAEEALGRIAQLYAVEKEARGSPPDRRAELRHAHAAPVFDDLEVWLAMQLTTISGKSPLAAAIRYALTRMERLRPYLDHGILNRPGFTGEFVVQ